MCPNPSMIPTFSYTEGGQEASIGVNKPTTYHPARKKWDPFAPRDIKRARVGSPVKVIQRYAFADTQLETLRIPEGVEVIEHGAFDSCKSLTDVEIPSSLKCLEGGAFLNCSSLAAKGVFGVGEIAEDAFAGCTKLTSFTIPASLEVDSFVKLSIFLHEKLPNVTDLKFEESERAKKEWIQNNTVLHQFINNKCPIGLIEPFLASCPSAIKETNFLGQTPLHLCMTNGSSAPVTKFVFEQWRDALNEKNEIGQTPLDLWQGRKENKNGWKAQIGEIIARGKSMKATKEKRGDAFILGDNQAVVPYTKPVLLRCEHILLEAADSVAKRTIIHHGKEKDLRKYFLEQLATRNQLFATLLAEFARKIQFHEKRAIQQAVI